jgi:hypothetical protein
MQDYLNQQRVSGTDYGGLQETEARLLVRKFMESGDMNEEDRKECTKMLVRLSRGFL